MNARAAVVTDAVDGLLAATIGIQRLAGIGRSGFGRSGRDDGHQVLSVHRIR